MLLCEVRYVAQVGVLKWGIWVRWGRTKCASLCKKRSKTFENKSSKIDMKRLKIV